MSLPLIIGGGLAVIFVLWMALTGNTSRTSTLYTYTPTDSSDPPTFSPSTPTAAPKTYCIVVTETCGTSGQRLWGGGYQTHEAAQRKANDLNSMHAVENWHFWVEEEPYQHRIR